MARPRPIATENTLDTKEYENLEKSCEDYFDLIEKRQDEDSDSSHYIFEAALEFVYGKDVWAWINGDHSDTEKEYEEYCRLKRKFEKGQSDGQ